MAGQEQIHHNRRDPGDVPDLPVPTSGVGAVHKVTLDAGIDSVLDEIDSVLETNSEEFVRGFVQKGGE